MEMKRCKILTALCILALFLLVTATVHAKEELEHTTEEEKNEHPAEGKKILVTEEKQTIEKIIVDKNNKAAYNSIQDAINNAPSGSTIYVRNGYYNEILNIKKKIKLVGEDKEKTIINPASTKNSYAIRIAAEGVILNGFGIKNSGPGNYASGIKISADKTTITDCNIFDTPVGIAVWSSNNKISNCKFWGCSDEGIAFLGSSSNQCNNNIVTDCEFYDNCDGIELQYSSNNVISNCKFYDNTHAGIDAIGSSNNNNVISGCNLSNNKAFGIFFSRSTDNTISKCTFSENKIMATASKNIKVENCKLDGIYLKDKSSMTIEDCGSVLESKIKTVDSDYVLSSVEEIKTRFDSLQEKRDTIRNSIFLRIMPILSFIRSI